MATLRTEARKGTWLWKGSGGLKNPGSNVLTAQILPDCFSTRKAGRISNINFDEAVHKLSAIIK